MKRKNAIIVLVLLIAGLSIFVNMVGLLSSSGEGEREFVAVTGESVMLYGEGIYKNDSVSVVAQGKAVDLVTLLVTPVLLVALFMARKNSFRGKILLTGMLGYFLYTYISYVFLWTYNPLFLVYIVLMSLSLYAFIMCMMEFDVQSISDKFSDKLPRKFLGGFQISVAIVLGAMWLGRVFTSDVPFGLEHYTTLVIQGMDLGFVVPTALLSGILLIRNRPYGYLLTSVIVIKGITMFTAICAMIVNEFLQGVDVRLGEASIFVMFTVICIFALIVLLKNTKK